MPRTQKELEAITKKLPQDRATLTAEQLSEIIGAYTELGNLPPTVRAADDLKAYFVRQLREKFRSSMGVNLSEGRLKDIANYSVNALKSGTYNPQEVVNMAISETGTGRETKEGGFAGLFGKRRQDAINTAKNIANDIPIDYTREVKTGRYEETTQGPDDYSSQIAELQSYLTPLQEKAKAEKWISDYLAGLPAQQDADLKKLEETLNLSQNEYFQNELTPSIIQSLNARGLASGGDLTASLAQAGAGLQREVRNTIAPLRSQASQDVANKKYENILRGALEQGQSLESAMNFSRNLYNQDIQNQFTAGQNTLAAASSDERFRQQMALQLAMANSNNGPGALDYFLQYGLPVLGQVGSAGLGGYLQNRQNRNQQQQQYQQYNLQLPIGQNLRSSKWSRPINYSTGRPY